MADGKGNTGGRGGGRAGRCGYQPRGGLQPRGGQGGYQPRGGQPSRGGYQPRGGSGGRDAAADERNYQRDNQAPRGRPQERQQRTSDAYQSQSSTGHGYSRGSSGRGWGIRGSSYRGSRPQINFSAESLSLDHPHVDGPQGFKCPDLPHDHSELKALIPKNVSPGKLFDKKLHIKTNFFLAKVTLPKELFRYELETTKIVPEGGNKKKKPTGQAEGPADQQQRPLNKNLRIKIFKWLVPRIHAAWSAAFANVRLGLIHDFSRIMFTTKELESAGVPFQYLIQHQELEDEDDSDVSYRIVISRAEMHLDIPRLQKILNDLQNHDGAGGDELETIEQIYNILLKNIGGDTHLPFGNSLMKIPGNEIENLDHLGPGLCIWNGISAVFTMASSCKPYINIEIQNSAFRIAQSVNAAVESVLQDSRSHNLRLEDVTTWRNDDFNAVLDLLRSCKVTRVVGGRRIDGVVRGVVREPPSNIRFTCEEFNNAEVTVPEYFRRKYNININPNGLLLLIGATAQVPAELCTIKKYQSYERLLSENATRNMLSLATQAPDVKEQNIRQAIIDLRLTTNAILRDFGVRFNDQFLDLGDIRVLSPPVLCYGPSAHEQQQLGAAGVPNRGRITPQNGSWDLWRSRVEFFEPMTIGNWAVLILEDDRTDGERFINELRQNANEIGGMNIPEPSTVLKRRDIQERGDAVTNSARIVNILTQWKENWPEDQKSFVLVVIPRKGCNLYDQVKKAAELPGNAGVLTQCVVKRNFETANHSVVKNILLKINSKLGGVNHVPIIPECLSRIDILETPVMIVGIDVNHPSAGHGGAVAQPSFAAVTASTDRSGMPYMMHVRAQVRAERGAAEVFQNLDNIIYDMITRFALDNNENAGEKIRPSKIIVYRDGVGAGQFPEVLDAEMRAIREACERFDDGVNLYRPQITIIVAQKRHNVRFFLKTTDGRTENAPAGTVVDTEIVKSGFYLLSHGGLLGTSRPTHYQILWDDSDFTMDEIQALTNYLCYMYSRCNRAVSYPAPTYYAHWAAARANALCKTAGHLPGWWDGSPASLVRLNDELRRNEEFTAEFPMHFL